MKKYKLNDANNSINYSNLSCYNLEIREEIPNRKILLYENFDSDLSFIIGKFKNDTSTSKNDPNENFQEFNYFKKKKAFNLNELDKIVNEKDLNSTMPKSVENKILNEDDSKTVLIKSPKFGIESDNNDLLDKTEKLNNKIITNENLKVVLKRGDSLPGNYEKLSKESKQKSVTTNFKDTKSKFTAANLKENEAHKSNRQVKVTNKIKVIPVNQNRNILNSKGNSVNRQMSMDSKLKSFSKNSFVLSHHRENAKNNFFKNFEKKLAYTNQKKNATDLRKIIDYYENGLYENFMENYEKYRKKIVAICSNICDINNDTFYKKLLNYEILPDVLARMETLAMASENKIKERELEKEKDLEVLVKIAEDNQTSNKIIKKTHKGEIEIELNSPRRSYFEENIESSKRETNIISKSILPPMVPELPEIPDLINGTTYSTDRSDSGLFSDEDRDEIINKNTDSKLMWSSHLKFELDSSFLNVSILSTSNYENSFASEVKNLFFKSDLSLEIEGFDYFKYKNGDLMVQLKKVNNKLNLVFVKFEKSKNTSHKFYTKLYNYLVKRQNSMENLLCYARVNLDKEHKKFINKFYLLPLKNKHVLLDENLKKLFSINVERTRDSILGVFVSNKINLKIACPKEKSLISIVENFSLSSQNKADAFWMTSKVELEHEKNIYEYLLLLFQRIIDNNWFNNLNLRRELILFFTKFDKLNGLTDEQRIHLKDKFFEKLPDLVFIIIRSSPNNLINIESLHDLIQTCIDKENTENDEIKTNDEFKSDVVKKPTNSPSNNVLNDSSEIEMVSDDEIEFPMNLNNVSKSEMDFKKNAENKSDDDSISYISDDDIDIGCATNQTNSIDYVKINQDDCENKQIGKEVKCNSNTSEAVLESSLIDEKNGGELDVFMKKIPLTPDQEKTFEYKIIEFEKNRFNLQSVIIPELNKPDIRIVNFSPNFQTIKPRKRNYEHQIFTKLAKNFKMKTSNNIRNPYDGVLKQNSFKTKKFSKFNRNIFIK